MASSKDGWEAIFLILRSPRSLLPAIVLLSVISLFYLLRPDHVSTYAAQRIAGSFHTHPAAQASGSSTYPTIQNSTLGFERIFVLNLPERTDKLDAFTISSSLHSFTFDVAPGVHGAEVLNKTLPTLNGLPSTSQSRNTEIGAWRAHLNIATRIVRERISTALIFEDDADWDVDLRNQLEQFAQGSRYISSSWHGPTELKSKVSPYGEDWDLLWLGHCGVDYHSADTRQFIISNDPTVPSPRRRVNYQDVPDMSGFSNSTRLVLRVGEGVCVFGYALSYRGAQKLLLAHSTATFMHPFDISVRVLCSEPNGMKCIGVYPSIIGTHKAAGNVAADSDINSEKNQGVRKKGFTNNVVRSTRLNWHSLLYGAHEDIEVQYPGDTSEITGEVTMRTG